MPHLQPHKMSARRSLHLRVSTAAGLLVAAVMASGLTSADAETTALSQQNGTVSALTTLRSRELTLSSARPPGVKKIPPTLAAPLYGEISLGPRDHPTRITVLLDAPAGRPSRLFVDSNADGDLTNDPAPIWNHRTTGEKNAPQTLYSEGGATVQVRYGDHTVATSVHLSRNDTSQPARGPESLPLYYAPNFARQGTARIGSRSYPLWLVDATGAGDYRGSGITGRSGIFLLIDVNGNGKIDPRGETYDAFEPFNIAGTTYEARNIDSEGSRVEIIPSSRSVAEILPPPDLAIGRQAPAFTAQATDGSTVRFPADYRGHLVLLYFWASWCGDCRQETPNLMRAYEVGQPAGLQVLGISLDVADGAQKLAEYARANRMEWPEIFDGKKWDAAVAQLYYIRSIPTALLIDGDTGKIVAGATEMAGDKMAATVTRAIEARTRKSKP